MMKRATFYLCLLCTSLVQAEILSVHGVDFFVDEKSAVQGGLVQITINGQAKLLPEAGVSQYIVEQYFTQEALFSKLSPEQIQSFILSAIHDGDSTSAKAALMAFFTQRNKEEIVRKTIELVADEPLGIAVLKAAAPELRPTQLTPRLISVLVYAIGKSDLEWIRTTFARWLYSHPAEIRFYLRERFFIFVREQDLSHALETLRLFGDIFSTEDGEYKKLLVLHTKLESIKQQGEGTSIISLKELVSIDPGMLRYVLPLFLDAMHSAADIALRNGRPEEALSNLISIDFDRRTPRTHELVLEAIKTFPAQSDLLLKNEAVHKFLQAFAGKDGSIKEHYAVLLEKLAHNAFELGQVKSGKMYLSNLSSIRMDPSAFNDSIRIQGALSLFHKGAKEEAQSLLDEVKTSIPFLSRLRLIRYRIDVVTVGALGLFLVLGALFLVLLRSFKNAPKKAVTRKERSYQEPPQSSQRAFVTMRPRESGLSREYVDCLSVFRLEPTATLAQLKAAYRSRVKDIHPDRKGETPDAAFTSEFVRLKEMYEKALELRGKLGLEDGGIEVD